ncbi:MAG: hypothetical protein ACI85O_003241 [Saprospiraceae bacterium]|jgi:hypothetical protein
MKINKMTKNFFLLLFLSLSVFGFSQQNICGTIHDLQSFQAMNELAAKTRLAAKGLRNK